MMNITASGIDTAKGGCFLVSESGDISFDTTVMADIWLVGGGMDGGDGYIDERGIFHGGKGGDGGCVYKFGRVKLIGGEKYEVHIADADEPSDTSFKFGQILFKSGQMGCSRVLGGDGGIVNLSGGAVSPEYGKDGVVTPLGVVGSSGSGGACVVSSGRIFKTTSLARGGTGAGNSRNYIKSDRDWNSLKEFAYGIDAVNYGCGGGGNTFCYGVDDIGVKSHGKGGCIIIRYEVLEDNGGNAPDCSIRYWK